MQGKSTAIVEGDDSNGWLAVDIGKYLLSMAMLFAVSATD